MSGPTGSWHADWERHLRLCREDAWGQCPDEPEWLSLPLTPPGFGLKAESLVFRPASLYGGWRRTVNLVRGQVVAGRLGTLLWPQRADLLLRMALERTDGTPRSYTMDFRTPADPRRCLGATVERPELIRRPGETDVSAFLDLVARTEEPHAALSPDDFDYSGLSPVPFTFDSAAIRLDGETLTDVEGFVLSVRNNLCAGPQRLGAVSYLRAAHRDVSLELTKLADSDAVNAAIRSGGTLSFEIALSHPEGHSLSLTLPVLHPESAPEAAEPGDVARTTVRMEAGVNEAGDDVTWTVSLSD
jgi:hypothetical protein